MVGQRVIGRLRPSAAAFFIDRNTRQFRECPNGCRVSAVITCRGDMMKRIGMTSTAVFIESIGAVVASTWIIEGIIKPFEAAGAVIDQRQAAPTTVGTIIIGIKFAGSCEKHIIRVPEPWGINLDRTAGSHNRHVSAIVSTKGITGIHFIIIKGMSRRIGKICISVINICSLGIVKGW